MDKEAIEFRYSLIYLYKYFIKLKGIIFKLREKSRGKKGQLTEEEINFIRPILKYSYPDHIIKD